MAGEPSDLAAIRKRIAALRPWPDGEAVIQSLERYAATIEAEAAPEHQPHRIGQAEAAWLRAWIEVQDGFEDAPEELAHELERDIRELRGSTPAELARRLVERGWRLPAIPDPEVPNGR